MLFPLFFVVGGNVSRDYVGGYLGNEGVFCWLEADVGFGGWFLCGVVGWFAIRAWACAVEVRFSVVIAVRSEGNFLVPFGGRFPWIRFVVEFGN